MIHRSIGFALLAGIFVTAAGVSAQPIIDVSPRFAYDPQPLPAGGTRTHILTVMNSGNAVLIVSAMDLNEVAGQPSGWLSVTPTTLTIQPGQANAQQVEVRIDATRCELTTVLLGDVSFVSNSDNQPWYVVPVSADVVNPAQEVRWDTVMSHELMFDYFYDPGVECVALTMSDGGAFGLPGWHDLGLDYYESGTECGTRDADRVYLNSGSPFVMIKDGDNVSLTTSIYQSGTLKPYHWRQAEDSPGMSGGTDEWGQDYDSVYIGRLVNRDTTIGLERIFYAPRSNYSGNTLDFVVCHTTIYSVDGQAHEHVTVGDVIDWNVPSEPVNYNVSGFSIEQFIYLQGTDNGGASCQSNASRFATQTLAGTYTSAEFNWNPCTLHRVAQRVRVMGQELLEDTAFYRDGTPLVPAQPNPLVWWDITSQAGLAAGSVAGDQAVWQTFKADFTLGAADTLHFWSMLWTVREGSLSQIENQVCYSSDWSFMNVRGCAIPLGCCMGRVGDANGSGDCMAGVTISDVSVIIDALFITGACISSGPGANIRCMGEADVNLSGRANPTCADITIGDISILIDFLFITGPSMELPDCAQ